MAQFRRPRFCSIQAAKTERLQCDRGSGSIGHRLATSSPPRRGASQLLQLLYGDDHTVAGTRAPFRGFQGASASQLRSDTNHERPCTSGCRRHPASRSSAVSLHSQTAVAQRFSCEYRNRKPSAQAWAAWAWEGLVGKRRSPGTAFGPVDRSYVEALSMSSTRESTRRMHDPRVDSPLSIANSLSKIPLLKAPFAAG